MDTASYVEMDAARVVEVADLVVAAVTAHRAELRAKAVARERARLAESRWHRFWSVLTLASSDEEILAELRDDHKHAYWFSPSFDYYGAGAIETAGRLKAAAAHGNRLFVSTADLAMMGYY